MEGVTEQLRCGPLDNMHRVDSARAFRYFPDNVHSIGTEKVEIHRALTGIRILIAAVAPRSRSRSAPDPEAERRRCGLGIASKGHEAPRLAEHHLLGVVRGGRSHRCKR